MPKTKSARASYVREWRKNNYIERRFNKPLREYMELKYRDIYNEYCWFFKSLDEQHPSAKDLTKTRTYKNWKRRQLNCESSDDESETAEAELDQNEIEPAEVEIEPAEVENDHAEVEIEPAEVENDHAEVENDHAEVENDHADVLTVALEETLSPGINNIDINEVDNIIQQVINELEQDEAVRELLNNDELMNPHYQDEDEGIGLNVDTELEDIIEPFDYELEVEGVDF